MRTFLLVVMTSTACAMSATAADEMISAKIAQVNPEKGTIHISIGGGTVKSYDVLKKAKIELNGKAATLKDLGSGLTVILTYNKDLEVVTSLQATGKATAVPTLVELSEMPEGLNSTIPTLTADSKTIFWAGMKRGEQTRSIWTATRKSVDTVFEKHTRLLSGNEPTTSSDGRELIFLDSSPPFTLLVITRKSADDSWSRPKAIAELDGLSLVCPTLTGDNLVLYVAKTPQANVKQELLRCTRKDAKSAWSKPETISLFGTTENVRAITVANDGKKLFGTLQDKVDGKSGTNLVVFSSKDGKSFDSPMLIDIGGKAVVGRAPYYVAGTKELFFNTIASPKMGARLWAIRNFDPDTSITPLK